MRVSDKSAIAGTADDRTPWELYTSSRNFADAALLTVPPSPPPRRARRAQLARGLSALLLGAALSGCADTRSTAGYYWQSVSGHLRLMQAARPVDQWLADASTPAALKQRLRLAQRIRGYASRELGLPDNASYRRYADLHRSAALWNVVAAPPLSLTLHTWCFPVAGCIGYRGYYDEAQARAEAARMRAEDFETTVYGVPAYSTLGWTNWLGGDPLLNTFIGYPEGELARIIFHELAHQVAYAKDDTTFNESFATAVERMGQQRWLASEASDAARAEYARFAGARSAFRALVQQTRARLTAIYAQNTPEAQDISGLLAMKKEAMDDFRARYARLRAGWGGDPRQYAGYDDWVARANNAAFGAQAAYDALVPAFEALFARLARQPGDPWPRFYAEVRRLAALPPPERRAALEAELPQQQTTAPAAPSD